MNKKIMIWMFVFIVLSNFVFADLTLNNTGYWSFDSATVSGTNIEDIAGTTNLTKTASTQPIQSTNAIINESIFFSGDYDAINTNPSSDLILADNEYQTINCWVNLSVNDANFRYIVDMRHPTDGTKRNYQLRIAQNDKLEYTYRGAGNIDQGYISDAVVVSVGDMTMVTSRYQMGTGSTMKLSINGVNITGSWVRGNGNPAPNSIVGSDFAIGNTVVGTLEFPGSIDECGIWNELKTDAELSVLYNGGNGFNPHTPIIPSNFTITAETNFFNTTINTFNATINGTTYVTTNGQINTTIPSLTSSLFNITVFAPNHITKTYQDYNVSTDLIASLNLDSIILNVTATDHLGSNVNNFSVNASSYNSTDFVSGSTTSGYVELNLNWNETYDILMDADNYALYNHHKNVTANSIYKNITFTDLYTTNTVHFNFFDEESKLPITNADLELLSDLNNANYSSGSNSTLKIELLIPAEYIIRYGATGYTGRRYYSFIMTDRSYNNISLYLSNATSEISAIVYDEFGNTVENALIGVLKYDVSTGGYILVEQSATNFEGKTVLNLKKNDEFYKFTIMYNDELKLTTLPTYIYDDTITFQINTEEELLSNYYTLQGIQYSLTFNDVTNNFKLDYTDQTATTVTKACVVVIRQTGIYDHAYNNSCVSSPSGTVLVGVEAINGSTYVATAYITFDGTEYFLDKLIKTFREINTTGNLGMFLIILLTIALMFTMVWNPVMSLIITPLPLLFGSITGLVAISTGIVIFIETIAIILAVVISRRS